MPHFTKNVTFSGETHLGDRREKVMLDLSKLMTKVEEFNDCGDMDMMQQYVKDVMQVSL